MQTSSHPQKTMYPPGATHINTFNLFNAIAFQITLGAPMILFAKSLGASSTILGLIASFAPLTSIIQLPASRFLFRFGYKRFMLLGWSVRNVFIYVLMFIPLLWFVGDRGKLVLVITALLCFNVMRGIGACAMLPWITELIPDAVRGRFLSRDQFFVQLGCLIALIISAFVMRGAEVGMWEYAGIFLLSALGQSVSLFFLQRVPEVPASEETRYSSQRVPWWALFSYNPFLRLVVFNVLVMAVIGGLGVFALEFLRDRGGMSASLIMWLFSLGFVAAMVGIPFISRRIDLAGSRIILRIGLIFFGTAIFGWFLMASSVLPIRAGFVALMIFLGGLGGAHLNIANVRLAMSVMPVMGRNHFYALFSVVNSLALGLSPILWGVVLDSFRNFEYTWEGLVWRRHSIYFFSIFVINLAAIASIWFLREGKEIQGDTDIHEARMRRLARDWMR